jgi:DNA-binding NtrC family response regulator
MKFVGPSDGGADMPALVFVRRGEELLRVELDGARVVLGRSERSDIVIRTIDVAELQFDSETEQQVAAGAFIPGLTLDQMLRLREREIVESALRRFDNNRERVARELGVARSTLFKRLKDWGLTRHDESDGHPAPPP